MLSCNLRSISVRYAAICWFSAMIADAAPLSAEWLKKTRGPEPQHFALKQQPEQLEFGQQMFGAVRKRRRRGSASLLAVFYSEGKCRHMLRPFNHGMAYV